MSQYQIIENDVRLLRRILVARQLEDGPSVAKITKHLRDKGLVFVLPDEQSEDERVRYANRLPTNEQWLVENYGCILLPEYNDCIFLNSKWMNPYTLYVRLVEPVPELGVLGEKYWVPRQLGLEAQFRDEAERAHSKYVARTLPSPEEPTKPWWKNISILSRE
jgi:hypothetical protein